MSTVKKHVSLSNGNSIPIVGLGTWGLFGDSLKRALEQALSLGYRHIDTAHMHGNEEDIGIVLRKWKREELFITSKLPPTGLQKEKVKYFCQLSLQSLGLSYLDLYLVQLPVGLKYFNDDELFPLNPDGTVATDCGTDLTSIWKEMENLVDEGLVKNIGLSNFNEEQIQKVWTDSRIKPVTLQIEVHAYFQQRDLRRFCRENGISVTAYCPLGSPGREAALCDKKNSRVRGLLNDGVVCRLAEKCNKSPAQILLRHAIQKGIVVIPKAFDTKHLAENIDVFDFYLIPTEMKELDALDVGQFGRTFDYSFYGESFRSHPEFPFAPKIDESKLPHH